jgi:hypothetical protein
MDLEKLISDCPIGGLEPRTWVCVGPGYAREEVKATLLSRGIGFTSAAIVQPEELYAYVAGVRFDRVLAGSRSALARQEILRILLGESRISSGLPELRRLRRQSTFFRKLDRAMQAGRMAFAHAAEEEVYSERLTDRIGPSAVRAELEVLTRAYEAWLQANGLWDTPMVLREAIGAPTGELPEEIIFLSAQNQEALEQEFWNRLATRVRVRRFAPENGKPPETLNWDWERWHTVDDAAESLAERLYEAARAGGVAAL